MALLTQMDSWKASYSLLGLLNVLDCRTAGGKAHCIDTVSFRANVTHISKNFSKLELSSSHNCKRVGPYYPPRRIIDRPSPYLPWHDMAIGSRIGIRPDHPDWVGVDEWLSHQHCVTPPDGPTRCSPVPLNIGFDAPSIGTMMSMIVHCGYTPIIVKLIFIIIVLW